MLRYLQIGQLILDKYGRLGMITDIENYCEAGDGMVEIEWLNPRHGKMLFQQHKIEELRRNFVFFREKILKGL